MELAPAAAVGGEGKAGDRLELALRRDSRRARFGFAHGAVVDRRPRPAGVDDRSARAGGRSGQDQPADEREESRHSRVITGVRASAKPLR